MSLKVEIQILKFIISSCTSLKFPSKSLNSKSQIVDFKLEIGSSKFEIIDSKLYILIC